MLSKTTQNPTSLITVKSAICQKFVPKNPFTSDNVDAGRSRHQGPGVIGLESVELRLHGGTLVQVSKSGPNERRQRRAENNIEVEAIATGWIKPDFPRVRML
jgi:hypothetical protein